MNAPEGGRRAPWYRGVTSAQKKALFSASLGWMLDGMDIMLYFMVLAELMKHFGMSKATGGFLSSLTLLASAVGGILFGVVADRVGRVKALMGSILIYSVFTGACGLSTSVLQLAVFRTLLGLGMGGEWATGAALVAETWPAEKRGKAMGIVQSSWAVGYAAAAAVAALVLPVWGWRGVFFVGVVPAFFTLWIQRRVKEPELWRSARAAAPSLRAGFGRIFGPGRLRLTLLIILMNACTMFGWWGFNLWLPAYLSMPADQGGMGFSPATMSGLVIFMQLGMWLGYISFGFISDRFGRKRSYVVFLSAAAAFMLLYARARSPLLLLALGPFVAFFGTGYFTGFGALTAEIYPTAVRATAQGITYNAGRIVSAAAPFVVGSLAQTRGFGVAFGLIAAAFVGAALLWVGIPETKGRALA